MSGAGLNADHYRRWRSQGNFAVIYQESDPYGRWRNRLPREAVIAGQAADIVFTSGSGTFASNFRRHGAKDVRWLSQGYDPGSFKRDRTIEPASDVVVVANRGVSRVPWRGHSGAKQRETAIRLLQRYFGDRLALYGHGWDGPGVRGPVPFWDQGRAIQSGWVSANWDHYPDEPHYFSNRLPISLATGGVHVTNWHPGYEGFFPLEEGFLKVATDPEQLVDTVDGFLAATSRDERRELADKGAAWSEGHMSQYALTEQVVRSAFPAFPAAVPRGLVSKVRAVVEHHPSDW